MVKHTIKSKGGDLIHIDLNSHNSSGKSKNEMKGGVLVTESLKPHAPNPNDPVPEFKKTEKILRSKNWLLDGLTSGDVRDLKKLFSDEDSAKNQKIKEATLDRVKKSIKAIKEIKPRDINIRGSVSNKNELLKKKGLI